MSIFNIFFKKATGEKQTNGAAGKIEDASPDAGTIFFNSMTEIGLQPEKQEDGNILVKYQGENLVGQPHGRFLEVWDLDWSFFEADDPNLPIFYEAVNRATFEYPAYSVLLSDPDDKGKRFIRTRVSFMLHPDCRENTQYIQGLLHHLFGIRKSLRLHFDELLAQHQAASEESKRSIGFAPSTAAPEQKSTPEPNQELSQE